MEKYFCDICKKEFKYEPTSEESFPRYSIFVQKYFGDLSGLDMCPVCTESFKLWLHTRMEEN